MSNKQKKVDVYEVWLDNKLVAIFSGDLDGKIATKEHLRWVKPGYEERVLNFNSHNVLIRKQ